MPRQKKKRNLLLSPDSTIVITALIWLFTAIIIIGYLALYRR